MSTVESNSAQPPQTKHVASRYAAETLANNDLLRDTEVGTVVSILPDTNVLKIGAQSIIDRGRLGRLPDGRRAGSECQAAQDDHRRRRRHPRPPRLRPRLRPRPADRAAGDSRGRDLRAERPDDLDPDGQVQRHAHPEGAVRPSADVPGVRLAVIITGMPSYHWWEPPPRIGRLPEYRTDSGVYLVAEVFGARSMIFIKDEDGLFTSDPKKDPKAEFIPKISAQELIRRDLDDVVVERRVVEMMLIGPPRPLDPDHQRPEARATSPAP